MANAAINNIGMATPLYSELHLDATQARDRVLGFYRDFQGQLGELMKTLLDDSKDLELGGLRVPADQKYGTAGTFLIEQWRSEQEFTFSQLLDAYKFEQTLENKLNNLSFS